MMPDLSGAHTWPDVAYLALFVGMTVVNILHNKKIARQAEDAKAGVVDVKRATGLTNRAEDPDPAPEIAPPRRVSDPPGPAKPPSRNPRKRAPAKRKPPTPPTTPPTTP